MRERGVCAEHFARLSEENSIERNIIQFVQQI